MIVATLAEAQMTGSKINAASESVAECDRSHLARPQQDKNHGNPIVSGFPSWNDDAVWRQGKGGADRVGSTIGPGRSMSAHRTRL